MAFGTFTKDTATRSHSGVYQRDLVSALRRLPWANEHSE